MRRTVLWRAATISGLIVLMGCMENLLAPRKGSRDAPSRAGESISAMASGPSLAGGPPSVVGAVTVTFGVVCAPTMYTPPSVIDVGTDGTLAINIDGTLSLTPPSQIDEAATVGFQYDFTDATGQVVMRTGVVTTTVGAAPPLPDTPVLATLSYVPGSGADRTVFTPGSAMSIGPNGLFQVNGSGIPTVRPPDDFHSGGSLQYTLSHWSGTVTVGEVVVRSPSSLPPLPPIDFVSDRDGDWEIYVMNADGTEQTRLTNSVGLDDMRQQSPDGTRIAFRSRRDGNSEIYVMNTDGSGQVNLTNDPAIDQSPQWSPDGARIAFQSRRDGNGEVYVMNADGSGQTNVTNEPEFDGFPQWSPDGRRIAFNATRDGNFEIYVMNADGTRQTNLTNSAGSEGSDFHWSPDGTRIAFASNRDGNFEIYVMNADGSGQVNLTNHPKQDRNPQWSPDGAKIAYQSIGDGGWEVFVMNPDGSGQTNLTNSPSWDPQWSPDGTRIAFNSDRDGNWEVYVIDADGTGQTNLTCNAAADANPRWRH